MLIGKFSLLLQQRSKTISQDSSDLQKIFKVVILRTWAWLWRIKKKKKEIQPLAPRKQKRISIKVLQMKFCRMMNVGEQTWYTRTYARQFFKMWPHDGQEVQHSTGRAQEISRKSKILEESPHNRKVKDISGLCFKFGLHICVLSNIERFS